MTVEVWFDLDIDSEDLKEVVWCDTCEAEIPHNEILGVHDVLPNEVIDTIDNLLVPCEHCGENVLFLSDACQSCGIKLDEEYWKDFYNSWDLTSFVYDSMGDLDYSVVGKTDSWNVLSSEELVIKYHVSLMICCDKEFDECTCRDKVFWDDLAYINPEHYEKAYTSTSACSSCEHFYEKTCIPFRSWFKDTVITGKFQGSIDNTCSYFSEYKGKKLITSKDIKSYDY